MKKLVATTLAAVLALCLIGCASMTKEEYCNNASVEYLTSGKYTDDVTDLLYSLPLYEDGDIDYKAYGNLTEHCENIIDLTGYPDDFKEAHEDLVKGANSILSQVDIMVEAAACMKLYHETGDDSFMDEAVELLEALSVMTEQAGNYILDALHSMQANL